MKAGVPQAPSPVPAGRRRARARKAAGQDPAKRRQIMEGARRVFIDMGFDAASMNDITRAAGVSKGTIYVYFADKVDLFEALIEEERCKIFSNLYDGLENRADPRAALADLGLELARKVTSREVLLAQRTVIGACERVPELGTRFYERGPKSGHDKIVAFLADMKERGLIDTSDLDLAAYQFSELSLAGFFRQYLFGYRTEPPSDEELAHVVGSGVDMFLKAYGTPKLAEQEGSLNHSGTLQAAE